VPRDAPASCLAVVGLAAEARHARASGATTLVSGADGAWLSAQLARVSPDAVASLVSFGLAGALADDLRVGDVVLADAVVDGSDRRPVDEMRTERVAVALRAAGTPVRSGLLLGSNRPLATAREKAAARAATGALAVDMESHVVARWAEAHAKPFLVIRVVSDDARHDLPEAATLPLRQDGTPDLPAILICLVRRPAQLPALVRTGRDAGRALSVLGRVGRLLGPGFGVHL